MPSVIVDNQAVLKVLGELAGSKAKGQQHEPVRFHPFPARMPLSVAEHLVAQVTTSDAVVLDPMAGSGTTLVAAKNLGRKSLGFDRDPLAVLVSQTAVRNFDVRTLKALNKRILEQANKAVKRGQRFLTNMLEDLPEKDRDFLEYWFPPTSQMQLAVLRQVIDQEPESPEKDLAWVIFSSLIIAKSAGASYALDISRSRPHKRLDKPVVLPFDGWNQRFNEAVRRLRFVGTHISSDSHIQHGDARSLPLEDDAVDLVLTSPPYLNAIDYLRGHKFSLVWMGHRLEHLCELRGTMIGTERGLWHYDGLPTELEDRLDRGIEKNARKALVRRYLSDLHKVLVEIERVLRPGGLALLVVGPTIINAKRTDAEKIVSRLGECTSLRLIGSVVRRLNATWRSLPPPGSTDKQNFLANRMNREVIVALRK